MVHVKENKKTNKKIGKILFILLIVLLDIIIYINSSYAAEINSANIYGVGDCPSLISYKGIPVRVIYVEYMLNGVSNPAYCLDKTMPGVETGAYDVSINQQINDVGLWKVITNGYPYKTLNELGVKTKEEGFTATKQAIYCYIHGNNIKDYAALASAGEAGVRTVNALNKIVNDAKNSSQTKVSSALNINKNMSEWKQDDIDKTYMSKVFSVTADAPIGKYQINLTRENYVDIGGMKVTDLKNVEKNIFEPEEKFKVLIPISNMTSIGNFELNAKTEVNTKPVFYGVAPQGLQDHAITTAMYEDGSGKITENYPKNETKIIILKQNEETKEKLENVEFELLDENKNRVYSNLKTNNEGKIIIENIIPGKYFLKETKAIDGYTKYNELIEFDIEFNNQYTITVNNIQKENPVVDIKKEEVELEVVSKEVKQEIPKKEVVKETKKQIKVESIKKLPKTGM